MYDLQTADGILDRIEERCEQLSKFPHLGPLRPEIFGDARALVVERWLVIYRIEADGVQVVRIVDGAQDLSRLVLPPE